MSCSRSAFSFNSATSPWITPSDRAVQMYGLYKQGTQDPPFEKAENPGMFDLKVRISRLPLSAIRPLVESKRSADRSVCVA